MPAPTLMECEAARVRLGRCAFDATSCRSTTYHFELESVRPWGDESEDVLLTWCTTGRATRIKADCTMTRGQLGAADPALLAEEMRERAETDLHHAPTLKDLTRRG